jgi:hypothetical protein
MCNRYADLNWSCILTAHAYAGATLFLVTYSASGDDCHCAKVIIKKTSDDCVLHGRQMSGLALPCYTSVKWLWGRRAREPVPP